MSAAATAAIRLLAEEHPVSLRESIGSVLFTCIFLLIGILVAMWWLKRNT